MTKVQDKPKRHKPVGEEGRLKQRLLDIHPNAPWNVISIGCQVVVHKICHFEYDSEDFDDNTPTFLGALCSPPVRQVPRKLCREAVPPFTAWIIGKIRRYEGVLGKTGNRGQFTPTKRHELYQVRDSLCGRILEVHREDFEVRALREDSLWLPPLTTTKE